jgi:hypothetical protein
VNLIEDNASCYLKSCTSCICTAPPNRFDLKMHWFSAPSRNNNIKICISTKKIKRIKFKVNQPIKHPEWHWHASVAMHGKQPTSNEVPGKCERASRSWPDMAPAFALMGKRMMWFATARCPWEAVSPQGELQFLCYGVAIFWKWSDTKTTFKIFQAAGTKESGSQKNVSNQVAQIFEIAIAAGKP